MATAPGCLRAGLPTALGGNGVRGSRDSKLCQRGADRPRGGGSGGLTGGPATTGRIATSHSDHLLGSVARGPQTLGSLPDPHIVADSVVARVWDRPFGAFRRTPQWTWPATAS